MPILDRIVPGPSKAKLRKAIEQLDQTARSESERQGLPPERAVLWEGLCDGASETIVKLLTENRDWQLDWGLGAAGRHVVQSRLVVMYWWMLLFQIVLFRDRGLKRYDANVELPELYTAARQFINHLTSAPELNQITTGDWEEWWESPTPLQAALGLYSSVMELFGLRNKEKQRTLRASLFTIVAERIYVSIVRRSVAENLEQLESPSKITVSPRPKPGQFVPTRRE